MAETPASDAALEVTSDLNRADWFSELSVEMIGTFALIFMGVGAIILTGGHDLVAIALAHGLAIGLMVAASGHISGGAFNPAVVLALLVARKIQPIKAGLFVVAQLVGATLAALTLTAIFPSGAVDAVKLGVPAVGPIVLGYPITPAEAFLAEIVTTFFLVYVIFGVAIDKRGPATIAALCIGLAITMDILATGGISGAAMNPARWFGPAFVHGSWDNGIIWIAGPAVGAVLAALVYFYIYLHRESA